MNIITLTVGPAAFRWLEPPEEWRVPVPVPYDPSIGWSSNRSDAPIEDMQKIQQLRVGCQSGEYGQSRLDCARSAWFEHQQAMKLIRKSEGIV